MIPFLTSLFRRRVRLLLTPQGVQGGVLRGSTLSHTFCVDTPQALADHLKTLPRIPLEVLVDHADLYFDPVATPLLSRRDSEKLLAHRLADLGETDLKTALLPRGEGSPASPQVVHLKRSGDLDPWFKTLSQAPQFLKGCTFLPPHLASLAQTLGEGLTILIVPMAAGWVRHVICHGGNLLGTRLTELDPQASVGDALKHMEQETYGTLGYVRKLVPQGSGDATLILVVEDALKTLLAGQAFPVSRTHLYTPQEMAHHLGYQGVGNPFLLGGFRSTFMPRELKVSHGFYLLERLFKRGTVGVFLVSLALLGGMESLSHRLVSQRESLGQEVNQLSLAHLKKSETLRPLGGIRPTVVQAMNLESHRHTQAQLMPFVDRVGGSLGDLALLHKLQWQRDGHDFKATLWVRIQDRALTKQEIVNTFQGVKTALAQHLKGATVTVKQAPFGAHRKEKFSSAADQSQEGILDISYASVTAGGS